MGGTFFRVIFFKELVNINYHIEQCKEDSTQTLWSMFCIWKFAFKYFNVNCIYWWVVNLSMHFISVSLEYFVCFCDKYFYFILNEYFFSIGHYLYPKLVFCGRCICDKYFFSICHYLYPKLVGCGQVWEADCGIMRRSALATLEAPNKCTFCYSFYFMNIVI